MNKQLILHIGAGKTGTSSIQYSLRVNRTQLLNQDIYVPSDDLQLESNCSGQHVWYFANLNRMLLEEAKGKIETDLEKILTNIPQSRILISAENLSDRNNWFKIFEGLKDKLIIKIVFYTRRQDDYLLSAWQQWFAKNNGDFWAWLVRNVGKLGDWKSVVEDWAHVAKFSDFKVKPYMRKSLFNNDIVQDFYKTMDLNMDDLNLEDNFEKNPSFNLGVLDVVEKNNKLFDGAHDNDFYNFLSKMSYNAHKLPKQSSITHPQRMAILSRYDEINGWLNEKFGDANNQFFEKPKPNDYVFFSEKDKEELKWNILFESMFNLYKIIEKKA